ncbi:RiPP maturation radical SAM protein 1 [Heliobacterium gestii]|uniref:RiPP maturation radical SAM protein 1 n=1 Tax=Heliomicrobium gestii TaxID=2699 RepID=A0A845L8K5_HELGE|nr:RiPP maturation radical SAM C-methyltransferase [Heliomicrobium gestii]MBM7865671.1 ribosomal peptide maturation radical SAM protein 1 [Heliomicrobium gestii]MZP41921.1 RiPP maturation radical SAM protein 1 [Heliomicrobium gestii]
MKLLLVNMPWGKIDFPSIQLGILKSYLARHGIDADVSYQNLIFANMIGLDLYSRLSISSRYSYLLEWLFNEFLITDPSLAREVRNTQERDIRELISLKSANPFLTEQYKPSPLGNAQAVNEQFIEDELVKVCKKIKNETIPDFFYKLLNGLSLSEYDIIGFTCSFSQTAPALSLARIIKKKYKDKVILLGGNAVSGDMGMEYLRLFPWIDYIVYGEGERALVDLVEHLRTNDDRLNGGRDRHGHDLKGILYRSGDGQVIKAPPQPLIPMDDVPLPNYDEYFSQIGAIEAATGKKLKQDTVLFETARGCWWGERVQCKFCSLNGENLHYRSKKWETAYEDLRALSRRYERNSLICVDNILRYPSFAELLSALPESKLELELFWEVKPNLTRAQLQTLAKAGVKRVQAGIENFSTDVLKLIDKGASMLKNVQFIKNSYTFDIQVSYNFLFGFPNEKPAYYDDLLTLFPLIHHLTPPLYPPKPMILQRFSRYYGQAAAHHITRIEPMSQYKRIYPMGDIDIEKIAMNFSFDCAEIPEDLDYLNRITEAIKEWNIRYGGNHRPVLAYESGAGHVKIYDSRFGRFKSILLRGLAAIIFLHCDDIKTLNSIMETAQSGGDRHDRDEEAPYAASLDAARGGGQAASQEAIQRILEQLQFKKLMIREGDRYLSLAVQLKDIQHRIPPQTMQNITQAKLYHAFEELPR